MKKRALSLILAAVMVCALLPTAALADTATPSGSHYADVPANAWYAEAVNAMTEGGLLTGYTDGLFHPDDPITYAQFVTVLARVLGQEATNPANVPEGTHWAQTAWNNTKYERVYYTRRVFVYESGYKDGTKGTLDTPDTDVPPEVDDNLYRWAVLESLVKLASNMPIYNAKRYDSSLVPSLPIAPHNYGKALPVMFEQISPKIWTKNDIPDWDSKWETEVVSHSSAYPNGYCILLAYNLGITKGTDQNGTCDAYGDVTRAQLCQLLWNMGITSKNSVKRTQSTMSDEAETPCWTTTERDTISSRTTYKWHTVYSNHELFTTLQFYEVYPTYESSHIKDFTCDRWKTKYNRELQRLVCGRGVPMNGLPAGCKICSGEADHASEEQVQSYELEKQAAYDEHDQWLKEFEGTRQWEIATGKA